MRFRSAISSSALRWLGLASAGLFILGTGVWGAFAIWIRLAPLPLEREILSGGLVLLALAAIVSLALGRWRVVLLYGACFAAVLGWWATLAPSNDRVWAADVARTANGYVDGDRLVVHNVRNFLPPRCGEWPVTTTP